MPYFVPGSSPNLPVFIFGESYGGAYAVSLAWKIQEYSKEGKSAINLKGIGLGNAYVLLMSLRI